MKAAAQQQGQEKKNEEPREGRGAKERVMSAILARAARAIKTGGLTRLTHSRRTDGIGPMPSTEHKKRRHSMAALDVAASAQPW